MRTLYQGERDLDVRDTLLMRNLVAEMSSPLGAIELDEAVPCRSVTKPWVSVLGQ